MSQTSSGPADEGHEESPSPRMMTTIFVPRAECPPYVQERRIDHGPSEALSPNPAIERYDEPSPRMMTTISIAECPVQPLPMDLQPPDASWSEPAIEAYAEPVNAIEQFQKPIELIPIQLGQAMQEPMIAYEKDEIEMQLIQTAEDPLLDAIDTGEKEDDRLTKEDREGFETNMDDTLGRGDLDKITELITPYNLTKCKTNSLEKSLEVSYKLKSLAQRSGPDADDFDAMSNTVENFAVQLLEPLKSDDMKRAIFEGDDFDRIAEKIVLFSQKKFVSHPVVYNLLMRRWTGALYHLRYSSLTTWDTFKWILLNIWTIFDVVLFPIIFVLMYLIHKLLGFTKMRQDHHVVLILNATWKPEVYQEKMRQLAINGLFYNCDNDRVRYASIIRQKEGAVINEFESKEDAKSAIMNKTCRLETDHKSLSSCLKKAKEMLKNCPGSNSNKTVVIMTDDRSKSKEVAAETQVEQVKRDSIGEARQIKKERFRVICVGLGVHLDIKELESMATTDRYVILYHGDIQKEDVLQKVLDGLNGYDIYDRYVEYFNSPYFIFVRDTLSYLALLGLHFAMCLQPSTLHFTVLEWVIMLFFIGRLLMEIYQAVMERHSGRKITKTSPHSIKRSTYAEENIPLTGKMDKENDEEKEEIKIVQPTNNKGKAICQVFSSMMSRYFSDWWNALDLITLVVYTIILIFRSITWAGHITVSENRLLAVAGYFYGLNTMFLTLRVFGHIMESKKHTGSIQIALFQIIGAVLAIFWQFLAATLAFSLAITKVYVAEMSYASARNSTSHGLCENRKGGIACWWQSTTHLIWSILGIAELDPLKSSDGPSDVLAKLLYGIFLIMAVVMMMNMMIALLSNTYQQVEDNAFYEWSYRKATTIRTYVKYHPVPVPFNIISLAFMFLRRLCCGRCFKKQSEEKKKCTPTTEANNQDSFFDCLVADLQAEYFAAHGYAFPMAESNKMDLVLKETEGSHQLIGHIASQVFKYSKREDLKLKKEFGNRSSIWDTAGVDIKGHQLNYAPCTCLECAWKSPEDVPRHHGARFQAPLSKDWPGFEVLIQEMGERHFIAVGVATDGYNLHKFPGWDGNSAGYHVDDGRIFDKKNPKGKECEGAIAQRGDLIGCKILYDSRTRDGSLSVSFTVNGRVIGEAKVKEKISMNGHLKNNDFYPFIGIGWNGISLLFKLCSNDKGYSFRKDQSEEYLESILNGISELRGRVGDLEENINSLRNELIKTRRS